MNAERLHALVLKLKGDLSETKLINRLQQLQGSLQQVMNQPNPNHQQAVGEALKSVYEALENSIVDDFSPAWTELLKDIGYFDYLGSQLKNNLDDVFSRTQITPTIAIEEIQKWLAELTKLQSAVDQLSKALPNLYIGAEELDPGQCELGFIIPREAVDSRLDEFTNELKEFGIIFRTFSEIATGKCENFQIRTISSSDLMIYLHAIPVIAALVAAAIERIISIYKQLLEIRKLRQELSSQEVPDKALKGLDEHANTKMAKAIETITIDIMKEHYKGPDDGRKNEVTNALRISLNKIANRIDRGYNVEVRMEPLHSYDEENNEEHADTASSDEQKYLEIISKCAPSLQFMHLDGDPILKLPEKATPSITETSSKKKINKSIEETR